MSESMLDIVLKFDVDTLLFVASSLKEYVNEPFLNSGYIVSTKMQEVVWNKLNDDPSIFLKYDPEDPTNLKIYSEDKMGVPKLVMEYDTVEHEFKVD